MAEALKDKLLNKRIIEEMAVHLARHSPDFDQNGFIKQASNGLEHMELKERSAHITAALHRFLPDNFEAAADIILASLHASDDLNIQEHAIDDKGIAGWAVEPVGLYIAEAGMDHFDLSMKLLKELTKRFTAEFAIRFFLMAKQDKTLAVLNDWAEDKNFHVRRLVSEGTRPRLPWAMQLPAFIKDPSPVLPLLKKLKNDQELYVRRSVANHLNDISKDNPEIVLRIANDWKDESKHTDWILKHACRTLLKQGNREILSLFGFEELPLQKVSLTIETPKVSIGDELHFTFSGEGKPHDVPTVRLEYAIDFARTNGRHSRKIFQISKRSHSDSRIKIERKHSFKNLSTRKHYPGKHKLSVIVNGQVKAEAYFLLEE